ncbi:uncharacterized protein MEPE_06525 [Melanopsichium pennsylvanicum]|uniref:LIM zinc-binding domain-containing protein n=2 Tax=Melanopsichium pennsylvanicum TaxID=63383 RepID=A0AAJ4XSJ0_9BASI|nr:putative protein [Melanopsichium pennsylvanicum 4]SNX87814.1 uncharacterized protein MEPE_06525 [Melanopsichium pennsylvanicum]
MSTPTALVAISPNRLGFCQRCGDPVSNKLRCTRCGGTSKRSLSPLPAARKPDPWANRYVNSNFPFPVHTEEQEYLHNQPPPPLSPNTASHDPSLGFGMPSRISRDLRISASNKHDLARLSSSASDLALSPIDTTSSRLGSTSSTHQAARRPSNDYSAPTIKGSDGVLSKVCGTLVEPSSSRNKWACSNCSTIFARDSTLYAAPTSLQPHDSSYYCRDCYCKRYSFGECKGCGRDVLGSTKQEGRYVKAPAGLWHGKCWKCVHCERKDNVLVGMDGRPVCEGCFDRPRTREAAVEPSGVKNKKPNLEMPDIRRLTKIGAVRNGPMGATIAELTKKLGQQSVSASPNIPISSSRSGLNCSLLNSSSSHSSLEAPRSPAKDCFAFSTHAYTSSTNSMDRSASFTGSPPKPRPVTAQFKNGLNLAAFQSSFATHTGNERPYRTDSRSRSVSPVKRPEWTCVASQQQVAPEMKVRSSPSSSLENDMGGSKVPGSPSLPLLATAIADRTRFDLSPGELGRPRTSSGYPRPLNSPFSKHSDPSDPIQAEKTSPILEFDKSSSNLEPASATARCVACHRLPFERVLSTPSYEGEVMMVTLSHNIHLHAECFICSVCKGTIDGSKLFVRLRDDNEHGALGEGLGAFAHPTCSPTLQLKVVQAQSPKSGADKGQRSYRVGNGLDPGSALGTTSGERSHATHQRELKPSPTPSPATSMRDHRVGAGARPSILTEDHTQTCASANSATCSDSGSSADPARIINGISKAAPVIRPFQSTAGAASPTRSTILNPPSWSNSNPSSYLLNRPTNPAAGIFSRLNALSSKSENASLNLASTTSTNNNHAGRFGGMQCCAYCGEKLSSLECVLGPRGTQWHKNCLICRGPPEPEPKGVFVNYRRGDRPKWCGKRLDSGAKVNQQGEVRCRACYDAESSAFRIKA